MLAITVAGALQAQVWEAKPVSFSDPTMGWDISAASADVAWLLGNSGDYSASPWNFDFAGHNFARTTDGGQTWTAGEYPSSGAGYPSNIFGLDANVAWVSYVDFGEGNKLFKTIDGGQNWSPQNIALNTWINFVHFWDGTSGLAMGDPDDTSFEIFVTGNGGADWERIATANIPAFEAGEFGASDIYAVSGSNVVFVTNFGRVYHSANKGYNWDAWPAPLNGFPDAVALGVSGHTVVSFGDYSDTITFNHKCHLFRTDGSGTWTDITPTDNNFAVAGLQYIPGTGTLIGTFRQNNANGPFQTRISYDDGSTWTTIDEGAHIFKLDFVNATAGWGSEYKNSSDPSVAYSYAGDPLSSLFDPIALKTELLVYPNPTSGIVQFSLPATNAESYLVLVNDEKGRLVRRMEVRQPMGANVELNLAGLPPGQYTISLSNSEGVASQKLLKK